MADDMKPLPNGSEMPMEDAMGWPELDDPGKFQWIPKDDLCIDPEYQRNNVNNPRVLKIASSWRWHACGVLLINRRGDGTLWVYDGQHRLLAAKKRASIKKMPCLVFDKDEKASEAAGFIDANKVRGSVDAYSLFRAGLVSEDAACMAIRDIIEASGYVVSSKKGHRQVCCIAAIQKEYHRNAELMQRIWQVCVMVFKGEPVFDRAFSGLCYLERYLEDARLGSVREQPLLGKLVSSGHAKLAHAIAQRTMELNKGGAKIYADGIVNLLNKHSRTKRIPSVFLNSPGTEEDDE